jgi:hypothetical protein
MCWNGANSCGIEMLGSGRWAADPFEVCFAMAVTAGATGVM